MAVDSAELQQVLVESADIAAQVKQAETSAHLLLALFTAPNRAQVLLDERGVDAERLLAVLKPAMREAPAVRAEVLERAREIAQGCQCDETDCVHLLIAMTRLRACTAYQLLLASGLDLSGLRNTALSYYLGGHLPRRLSQLSRPRSAPDPYEALGGIRPRPSAGSLPGNLGGGRHHGARPDHPANFFERGDQPPPMSAEARPVDGAMSFFQPEAAGAPAPRPGAPLPPSWKKPVPPEVQPAHVSAIPHKAEAGGARPSAPPRPAVEKPFEAPRAPAAKIESSIESIIESVEAFAPLEKPSPERRPSAASRRFELDAAACPNLAELGRNLTALAAEGKIDPVVGREREIEEVIDILGKRRTNNPCLLGEPGVGKTAVVEGVARALVALAGKGLEPRLLIELDVAGLVAGTQLRGAFSEKLSAIKEEVRAAEGKIVVFIDELHTLIGAGSTGDGPQDAANELKSALARGDFPCIGATTHDEFRKYVQQDPALERRFTAVRVDEPSVPQTTTILKGIVGRYEEHHGVTYAPEALEAAAALAAKYVSDRFLPDKAISIIDLAGSRARREGVARVGPIEIARVVSRLSGVPEERLLLSDSARLLDLEHELSARVVGHEAIIERLSRVVRRNYAGFSSRRPMGSFLFLGPTGVGKTELARTLAEVLFGSADALVRLDMSECVEQTGVARLIGAPPGYVGFGEAGQLTEPIRRRPSSVVLLDEIEKAHRDVLMLLLQVLEEGQLTDNRGRHIDFSNAVVILTSNLGAEQFGKAKSAVGFGAVSSAQAEEAQASRALDSARAQLPAELWNRLDEKMCFRPLSRAQVWRIAEVLLADSSARLKADKDIGYEVAPEVVAHLLDHGGFDEALGARPMRQAVQRLIEAPLADAILANRFGRGDRVRVALNGETLAFDRKS